MKATEGQLGRIFLIRLDNGDKVPDCIERFAAEKGIAYGQAILIGGIGSGQVVTGPRYSDIMPPDPLLVPVDGAHEVVGAGILAPSEDGRPVLHLHASLGRAGKAVTGCLRPGVDTWLVGEVILYEITGMSAKRIMDEKSGFALLEIQKQGERH